VRGPCAADEPSQAFLADSLGIPASALMNVSKLYLELYHSAMPGGRPANNYYEALKALSVEDAVREKVANRNEGFRVGDRSRGCYATPAEFPLHDWLHVRPESLGFLHRSRAIFCRPVPNPNRYDSQLVHRCMQVRLEAARSLAVGENHCGGQIVIMMANFIPIASTLHSDAIMVPARRALFGTVCQ
jgi:hypothetical protein